MVDRCFENNTLAHKYARFRPPPPTSITEYILEFLEEKLSSPHEHVVDVGCGTGQSTRIWCRHFQKVTGCDVSEAQINEALKENNDNISYLICPAHNIPLRDHSVDLVSTVASLHWFDIEKFLPEAKRLLKPKGVLAVQSYHKPILTFDVEAKNIMATELMKKLLGEELGNYWPPKVQLNKRELSDVSFPFCHVVRWLSYNVGFKMRNWLPLCFVVTENKYKKIFVSRTFVTVLRYSNIRSEYKVTVDDVIGFITSYSSYQSMKETEPDKLDCVMEDFRTRLLELAGGEKNTFSFGRDHYLILCRDED